MMKVFCPRGHVVMAPYGKPVRCVVCGLMANVSRAVKLAPTIKTVRKSCGNCGKRV